MAVTQPVDVHEPAHQVYRRLILTLTKEDLRTKVDMGPMAVTPEEFAAVQTLMDAQHPEKIRSSAAHPQPNIQYAGFWIYPQTSGTQEGDAGQ